MKMKKIFAILLSSALTLSFGACKDDKKSSTSTPVTSEDSATSVRCTFTVQTNKDALAANVAFTLTSAANTYELVSDENGAVTAELAFGEYTVAYDTSTLPEYCTPDVYSVTVNETSTAITLLLIDNSLDGSIERPFFISDNVTDVSLAANAELYYVYRGAESKTLTIENENVAIVYNGVTYTATDGAVSVELQAQIGASITFCVKNVSSSAVETQMTLLSPLGSMSNPIPMTENSVTVTVAPYSGVFYQWTATQSGILVISADNAQNNLSMTNMTTYAVSSQTNGSACEYLAVSEGDPVVISVSSLDVIAELEYTFSVAVYAGTESDPIPLMKDSVDLSLNAGATLSFSAEAGKTLKIQDENVSVVYGGDTYIPDADGIVTVVLTGSGNVTFTLNNTAETINGVEITLK